MAQNKVVSRNFALALGIICVIAVVAAGVFAFSYFTKPIGDNFDNPTPTPTMSTSITTNPTSTSTPSRIQITPNPTIFDFHTIAPTSTPNQTVNLPDDALVPRDDLSDALNRPIITLTNLTMIDQGEGIGRYPGVEVNCTITNTGFATAYNVNLTFTAYKTVTNEFINLTQTITDKLEPQQSIPLFRVFRYAQGEFWHVLKPDTLTLTPKYATTP